MAIVDELIRQLETGDPNERYQAASALGQLGDPKALPALIRALDDNDANVHIAAAGAVGKIGDLNAIQNLLDAYERRTVRFAQPIFDAVGEILDRTSPDDKNRAVFARAVDRLIQIVQQDDPPAALVRAPAAAEALARTRDPKAIPVLLERLRGGKPYETAKAAARALRHFNDPQVVQALTEVATNTNISKGVREAAVQSLGDIGNPNAVDMLISILEDSSIEIDVRADAAHALGRTGDPRAIEPLIQRMKREWKVNKRVLRQAIVDALSAFRDQRAIDALIWALSTDYYIARAAAESLKKLRDPRAVEPLIRLVAPPDDKANYREHEREFAAQILGAIADPRAIPALAKALRDDYCERLPQYAAESLLSFVLTHPDAVLRISPDDRHLLGRLIQETERDELSLELC